jgi:hypothetical protein
MSKLTADTLGHSDYLTSSLMSNMDEKRLDDHLQFLSMKHHAAGDRNQEPGAAFTTTTLAL